MTAGDASLKVLRPAHRPSRRSSIIETAVQIFSRQGPRATVQSIADACGLTSAAIYYHFPDKDALFSAAVELVADRIESATTAAERVAGAPLSMRDAAEVVWRWAADHRDEARMLYSWAASGPSPARAARQRFIDDYRERILARIPGRPRDRPEEDLADQLGVRAYLTLAMATSEAWVTDEPIGGTDDQLRIVDALSEFGRRLTGAP